MESIKQLNGILAEKLGEVQGKPRYAWVWSPELTTIAEDGRKQSRTESGLYVMATQYAVVRQIEGPDRWVLASFQEPPSESVWTEKFGTSVPYPSNGYYIATSHACKAGITPTKELTDWIAAMYQRNAELSEQEHCDNFTAAAQKRQSDYDKVVSDCVSDACPAFGAVPGQKDIVSFGGIGE